MSTKEVDSLMQRKNESGDIEIHYPVTTAENVIGLGEQITTALDTAGVSGGAIGNIGNAVDETKNITQNIQTTVNNINTDVTGIKTTVNTINTTTGTINSGVNELKTNLGTANNTLGTINTNVNNANTNITAIKNNVDATISSRASASTALSNGIWTDARAAKLDTLDNGTYGLNALNSKLATIQNTTAFKTLVQQPPVFFNYNFYNAVTTVAIIDIANKSGKINGLRMYCGTSAPNASYSNTTKIWSPVITIDGVSYESYYSSSNATYIVNRDGETDTYSNDIYLPFSQSTNGIAFISVPTGNAELYFKNSIYIGVKNYNAYLNSFYVYASISYSLYE